MDKKEKELLLKDLCARLPYRVQCLVNYTLNNETTCGEDVETSIEDTIVAIDVNYGRCFFDYLGEWFDIKSFKPYLFPLSSMTEEQYNQLYIDSRVKNDSVDILDALANDMDAIDWLNKNHFDYQGLIEKGLAYEAPEGMYK